MMCQTPQFAVDLANPEIFLEQEKSLAPNSQAGRAGLVGPGCAGAGSQHLPCPAPGLVQPCLSTVGAPICISALQSRPSPARGLAGLRFPGRGRA